MKTDKTAVDYKPGDKVWIDFWYQLLPHRERFVQLVVEEVKRNEIIVFAPNDKTALRFRRKQIFKDTDLFRTLYK